MGKNKGGKKLNPVFRVAGGKAAKAKAKFKAQPVVSNLKKLNANTKAKTEHLDSNLVEVRKSLEAPAKKKDVLVKGPSSLPPADINMAVEHIANL